jgi:hypothetical protein
MSAPFEDLEALINGEVRLSPLTPEQRQQVTAELGAVASADALGTSIIPVSHPPHHSGYPFAA